MAEKRAFANWVLLLLLFAVAGAAGALIVCNVALDDLAKCRSAVSGNRPTPPSAACCSVVKRVNIPCLCGYKSSLPSYGLIPALVYALPKKCGLNIKAPCADGF